MVDTLHNNKLTVMGFDYGSKRLGVAIGQTLTATANPLTTIKVKNAQPDWSQLTTLIREWQPHVLVVGYPPLANGAENALTRAIHQFKTQLQQRFQLPVHLIDETLSTVAAMEYLSPANKFSLDSPLIKEGKKKSKIPQEKDAVAAKIILETWLAECA